MKELVVVPEFHVYGAPVNAELILKKLEGLRKLNVSILDAHSLYGLQINIKSYYGSEDDYNSLRGEVRGAVEFKIYARAAETKPDTLFLEMIEDPYIEKACEHFNKTHDVEKVFEALSSHFLAHWVQANFDVIRAYGEFFNTLNEQQKPILIHPDKLLEEALKLKRALYRRYHNEFGKLLSTLKNIYIVKTADSKAMIRQILKKKQFFKKAAIICGLDHAADFYELKNLFSRNGIRLLWPSKAIEELVVEHTNEIHRKVEKT